MALLTDITDIDTEQLKEMLAKDTDRFVVVDVRTPAEYRQGHIPGAKHVPLGEIQDHLDKKGHLFESGLDHVFYCRSGARSQRAALLSKAGRMVEGRVFNLRGGMMAWDGMALPDVPRVDILAGADSVHDILVRAMDMEKAAHLFYADLAARLARPESRDMTARLTDMEMAHARVVYSRLRKLEPEIPAFEELFDPLEGAILEGGRTLEDLGPWVDAALEGTGMELMELALEIEYNALDLYESLAHSAAGDQEAQDVYLDLARQEKNHVRIILDRLEDFA